MKRGLILSIIVNMICLPLAGIYIVRKIQFYNSLAPNSTTVSNENVFWKIRNSEFKTLQIDSNSIVFVGDSNTQNFEISEAFSNINIKNRGIILDGTTSLLGRINYIANNRPKKIFIQIGINDLLSGVPSQVVVDDINRMIKQIKNISPKTTIFIQSVFPTNWNKYKDKTPVLRDIIDLNNKLQTLSSKSGCTYIDLFHLLIKEKGLNPQYDCGDNLHLNGQGYLVWRNSIEKFI
ncbi:GDSL-type esterase/lipase family protein [Mucilaginibacter sp.]|uniref:GDSL-type esterase/lipase family protein n=1 Tax=Mucilaginibacter sp. TaxID=1882438 RepID=UPI002ED18E24